MYPKGKVPNKVSTKYSGIPKKKKKNHEPGRIYFKNILFDIINRDLFKKIWDTKGIFHVKMGTIKDRNCKDLTETEEINKRWQEYTEELYQKGLKPW